MIAWGPVYDDHRFSRKKGNHQDLVPCWKKSGKAEKRSDSPIGWNGDWHLLPKTAGCAKKQARKPCQPKPWPVGVVPDASGAAHAKETRENTGVSQVDARHPLATTLIVVGGAAAVVRTEEGAKLCVRGHGLD